VSTGERKPRKRTYSVVCKFDAGDHHDATVSGGPVVVADETALASTALSICDFCHSETNVWWGVEGSGIEYGYAVPAGLDLDGEMSMEAVV
jgi:hypothetical protein